jgi:SPP1 gp7 family putative phage head morphogenesis protein
MPDFRSTRRLEEDYRRAIERLVIKYLKVPKDATPGVIRRKVAALAKNKKFLEKLARVISGQMVTMVSRSNASSWQAAAAESSRGSVIYTALREGMRGTVGRRVREIVSENARLISSIPAKLRNYVNQQIAESQREGLRPETIAAQLRARVPQLTRSRAALIARTEVAKATTALTEARSAEMGIGWYLWSTSRDSRVRPSHRKMENVLVAWNDPPSPELLVGEKSVGRYHAGEIYNCRCDAQPAVSLDVFKWPMKVYSRGRIQYMTRAKFQGLMRRAA